ncbi:MAG: antibiotic biosynthesis monooxygenase [Myxococcota bacterium]|nr:antibiotic biosynthesis monooxygenase [Myxococcota bacterium]
MFVVCVTVSIVPGQADAFIAATVANAAATRLEAGNLRFDVLRAADDPNRFFLYEVYRDEEAFREHQRTAHYTSWKGQVAPWMAEPRVGVKHISVFPEPWTR